MKVRKRLYSLIVFFTIGAFTFVAYKYISGTNAAADVSYDHTYTIGGGSSDVSYGVAVDSSGNVFHGGNFQGSNVDLNGTGGVNLYTSNGGLDSFIVKYDSNGNWLWGRSWGGTTYDYVWDLAVDAAGNIYITGMYEGSNVDFNGTGGVDLHSALGLQDTYITRYNADGTYGWTVTFGSPYGPALAGYDVGTSITVVGSNVYVSGEIHTQTGATTVIDFDGTGGTDIYNTVGLGDAFIVSYTTSGSYNWYLAYGTSNTYIYAKDIQVDSSGAIYVTGEYSGLTGATVDLDGTAGVETRTIVGQNDAYLAKYNSNTSFAWARAMGGTSWEYSDGIDIDSSNNPIITGRFYSTSIDFNDATGDDIKSTFGNSDIFITKYNTDGSYGWTKQIGGTGGETGYDIVINQADDYYITGYYQNTVNFDVFGTDPHTSNGSSDIFITKYYADETYAWTQAVGGGSGETGLAIAHDNGSHLYATGMFQGTVDFDPTGVTENHTSNGSDDLFLTGYDDVPIVNIDNLAPTLNVTETALVLDAEIPSSTLYGSSRTIRLTDTSNIVLAELTVDMTEIRDWSSVTAEADTVAGKSFVHNLTTAPGSATTFDLYIPYLGVDTSVVICPNATSLAEVTDICSGGYQLESTDPSVSQTTIGSQDYWVVSGLSGTGGMEGELQQQQTTTYQTTTQATTTYQTTTYQTTTYQTTLQTTTQATTTYQTTTLATTTYETTTYETTLQTTTNATTTFETTLQTTTDATTTLATTTLQTTTNETTSTQPISNTTTTSTLPETGDGGAVLPDTAKATNSTFYATVASFFIALGALIFYFQKVYTPRD